MPRIRKEPDSNMDAAVGVLDSPVVGLEPFVPTAVEPTPIRTAAAPPPVASTTPAVPESVARRNSELRDAERILERKVAGEQITDAEQSYLLWLFGDEAKLNGQFHRVNRRRSAQRRAGTALEREAAKVRVGETAAELTAAEAAAAAAQQRLVAAQTAAAAAVRTVEGHDAALVQLTDYSLLSDPDRQQYQFLRQKWETNYGTQARSLRHQAEGMRATAALDPAEDRDRIASYCQSTKGLDGICKTTIELVDPSVKSSTIRDRRFVRVDAALWQAHVAELLQQADGAEAEASRLEEAGQGLRAELDRMLRSLIPD